MAKLVKDTEELEQLGKGSNYFWICGPIETGKKAEDYIPKDAVAYTFTSHEPEEHPPGTAQYRSISGSYYYLSPRSLEQVLTDPQHSREFYCLISFLGGSALVNGLWNLSKEAQQKVVDCWVADHSKEELEKICKHVEADFSLETKP